MNKVSTRVFGRETKLKGDFPLNMLLIGPHSATIPQVCQGLVAIADFLVSTPVEQIIAYKNRFSNIKEFIYALVPVSVISSRSFNTVQ